MLKYHDDNERNEEAILASKTEGTWGYRPHDEINHYSIEEITLKEGAASVDIFRLRVLERTKAGAVVHRAGALGYIDDYFYPEETEKKQICLHYTAGGNAIGWLTRHPDSHHVGVHFVLSTTGRIFELVDTKYWGHSSNGGAFNKNIVSIEIANPGAVRPSNFSAAEQAQWLYLIPDKPYRGCVAFQKYTDKQYESLRKLLAYLCAKYKIDAKLLPDDRPGDPMESTRYKCLNPYYDNYRDRDNVLHSGYKGTDGIDLKQWRGVVSHVNWAGMDSGSWLKQDIGPCFDWDRILAQSSVFAFPLQREAQSMPYPPSVYHNNETQGGGSYVVGSFCNIHSGIHLFPESPTSPVRAMADGAVVAARFIAGTDPTVRLTNNYNGFVLLKHRFRDAAGTSEYSLYSLYMHLAPPTWTGNARELYANVPWTKRLFLARNGAVVDGRFGQPTFGQIRWVVTRADLINRDTTSAEVYKVDPASGALSTEPFELRRTVTVDGKSQLRAVGIYKQPPPELRDALLRLQEGNIITFREPYFAVAGGESIGYLGKAPGTVASWPTPFLHWEVFAPTKEGSLRRLLAGEATVGKRILSDHLIQDSSSDNYLDPEDFKNLFAKGFHKDEREEMVDLLSTVSSRYDRFSEIFDRLRKNSPETFAKDIHKDLPAPPARTFAFGLDLKVIKAEKNTPDGSYKLKLEFLDEAGELLPRGKPYAVEVVANVSEAEFARRVSVPAETVKIRVTSAELHLAEAPPPKDRDARFKEALKPLQDLMDYRLRNVLLAHPTEWSEAGIKSVCDKVGDEIGEQMERLVEASWWGRTKGFLGTDSKGEYPVFSGGSIFDDKILPKDGKIDNLHPVTALWLLALLQEHGKIVSANTTADCPLSVDAGIAYLGWALDCSKPNGGKPAVGDDVGVLAIRNDYNTGAPVDIAARGPAGWLNLDSTRYSSGVAKLALKVGFWGRWTLVQPSGASNTDGAELFVEAPDLAKIGPATPVRRSTQYAFRLFFRSNCPTGLSGVVFFKCGKAGTKSGRLCDRALRVIATREVIKPEVMRGVTYATENGTRYITAARAGSTFVSSAPLYVWDDFFPRTHTGATKISEDLVKAVAALNDKWRAATPAVAAGKRRFLIVKGVGADGLSVTLLACVGARGTTDGASDAEMGILKQAWADWNAGEAYFNCTFTGQLITLTETPPAATGGTMLVQFDPWALQGAFAKTAGAASGDKVDVSAGFYGPNGGSLALRLVRDYKPLNDATVELQAGVMGRLGSLTSGDHGVGKDPNPEAPFMTVEALEFGNITYTMAASAITVTSIATSAPAAWKGVQTSMTCNGTRVDHVPKVVTIDKVPRQVFTATVKLADKAKGTTMAPGINTFVIQTPTGFQKSFTANIRPKFDTLTVVDPTLKSFDGKSLFWETLGLSVINAAFGLTRLDPAFIYLVGSAYFVPTDYRTQLSCRRIVPGVPAMIAAVETLSGITFLYQSPNADRTCGYCNERGVFGAWVRRADLKKKAAGSAVWFAWSRPGDGKILGVAVAPVESGKLRIEAV